MYDLEYFADWYRDTVNIKIRLVDGNTKRGFVITMDREYFKKLLEIVPPGAEYPQLRLRAEW